METNNCLNCGEVIEEDTLFCDEKCADAWWGIDRMQIEREKLEGQREDAGEHRRELSIDRMIDLKDEAIRLMVRE